jgi:hypothetical protein
MKRAFAMLSLLAVVIPASAFAKDMKGLWGPGYFRAEAPVGVRVWMSPTLGLDLGLGFSSGDAGGEDLTDYTVDLGLPIVMASAGDANFFVRPGVLYTSDEDDFGGTIGVDATTTTAISASLGVEYFFTERFSVQAAHGVFWASSEPPVGDSSSQFATEDFGISNIGFHYYFGGSQ